MGAVSDERITPCTNLSFSQNSGSNVTNFSPHTAFRVIELTFDEGSVVYRVDFAFARSY